MFEITDPGGEVWINYKGEGRRWVLAMTQEEESQLLGLLLARAGGLQNLTLAEVEEPVPREVWMPKNPDSDECEGPDECDAHHPCRKHAEANAGRFQQR
jgi:hypothetical protein